MKCLHTFHCFVLFVSLSNVIATSELYNFGESFGDTRLPPGDEGSTDELSLREPIVFYGQTYYSIFVNINGLVSFLTEIPYFFNAQFPLDYPAIAPFYSDVDISAAGNIWYRENSDPATISRVQHTLAQHFSSAEAFEPTGTFVVTWEGVGAYDKKTDKRNTYQLIIATDRYESYAIFRYQTGGLQWLQGEGKTHGLPDALGQAGMIAEDGRFYIIKGSGTDQVRNLDRWTNCGEPGVWMFRIGQISHGQNVSPPDLSDGAPVVAEEGRQSSMSCATGGSTCHSSATCVDYDEGFCCQCADGSYGNGINCLRNDIPIRVTGIVSGEINGVHIDAADLHSYVLSSEGRTYTAVSKITKNVGYDLQSLTSIGEGIAWLFAIPQVGIKNGFTLTGGAFNRSVEILFPQSGHKAYVEQMFAGVDVFNNVALTTKVRGSIPSVPFGSELEVSAFNEEFTRVKKGQIRAKSQRSFKLKGQTLTTPFSVETLINYEGCSYEPMDPNLDTLRMKVAENIFIRFDDAEEIVRYSFSAKIGSLDDEDPCIRGREQCGSNSECIVDGDDFRCLCEHGYDYSFEPVLSVDLCRDMNECDALEGRNMCNENALCTNTQGSYLCHCNAGYTGDGFYCDPEVNCQSVGCDPNASCRMVLDQPRCECRAEYKGDGFFCTPDYGHESCHILKNCSPYAVCSPTAEGYSCRCLQGYDGDGYTCAESYNSRDSYGIYSPYDDSNRYDTGNDRSREDNTYPGFQDISIGHHRTEFDDSHRTDDDYSHRTDDDYSHRTDDDYSRRTDDDPFPLFPMIPDFQRSDEDSYEHEEVHGPVEMPEEHLPVLTPYDPLIHEPEPPKEVARPGDGIPPECVLGLCFCGEGLLFNGRTGLCEKPIVERHQINLDSPFAICFENQCLCPTGYKLKPGQPLGDEKCIPDTPDAPIRVTYDHIVPDLCTGSLDCAHNAECLYNPITARTECICIAGLVGDGAISCEPAIGDLCSTPYDCVENAQCLYDSSNQRYECKCDAGFNGDPGVTYCTEEQVQGCNVLNDCGVDALCVYDEYLREYKCQCMEGHEGDGYDCRTMEVDCNVHNICGQNAECRYNYNFNKHECVCRPGYTGDGMSCDEEANCHRNPSMCHSLASCYHSVCVCDPPAVGDGIDDCIDPRSHEKGLLLINQGLSVLRMPIGGESGAGYPIHVDPFMTAVGADTDCLKGRYYWTDVGSNTIRSSNYDGSGRMPIMTKGTIGSPEDVSVDWVSGNIYWTDSANGVVSVADLRTGLKKDVVTGNLVNPRGIAVHPGQGMLFWSDWNRNHPKIESSGLDGSNRKVLVEDDIALPNSLVIDFDAGSLCWADAGTHKIECIGPHGRRVIAEDVKYPFGLTIHERAFFYTDWEDKMIHEVNSHTRREEPARLPPLGGSGKLFGLAAVQNQCPNASNRCQHQHGGCASTHLCLPTGDGQGGISCACPDEAEGDCIDYQS